MKRAGIYLRVSTDQQTTENQLRILTEVAERSGWTIVRVFEDAGISGAKGRDQRPGYDALLKAVHRREVDIVAAYAVDRLGRSLTDLVAFLGDIQARGCDLYLHQQSVDTSTPSGRMLFQMLAVFSEFERELVRSRVRAGLARARAKGVQFGRPSLSPDRVARVEEALKDGQSIRVVAKATGTSTASVQRIKRSMLAIEEDRLESVAS
ncbi:resolvase [Brevundimonas nasdae]|uniref:Resolvase n=1 Tax=Brevundimonas nasdae TaxID=172043 RepID=A0A0B4D983_9CAUL|nr:recombinase family protein [Brevundimonas nasdae]KIC60835.1 resolvase [Brevundimonas nasdae]